MTLDEFYKYYKSNKEEFFKKLDKCINTNNISTNNASFPMIIELYKEIRQDKINGIIKPTKGKLKISEEQK